jgi:hypothetical protein
LNYVDKIDYGTPHFREALDEQARENLRRSIRSLGN